MKFQNEIKKIKELLSEKKNCVVISHFNPDGDAIGSGAALSLFLKDMGHDVSFLSPNALPAFLNWIPGVESLLVATENHSLAKERINNAELVFMLDFNESKRVGVLAEELMRSTAFKVLLDHHENPSEIADILISESWRGSTGEMVYLLMKDIDKSLISRDIATGIYVAIMTDTGNFRYSSSYQEIFNIAGELMHYNIDKNTIYSNIYDVYSEQRMKLMGFCMSEKLVVIPGYDVAYIYISKEELDRYEYQDGDTEGFVNIPFSIKGVRMTALFTEKKDMVKISFRSKGDIAVNDIASRYFSGGGHINAAGGESSLNMDETLNKFKNLVFSCEELRNQ